MSKRLGFVCTVLLLMIAVDARGDIVLFDGTKATAPDAQGWIYLTNPLIGSQATKSFSGNVTILDTTKQQSDHAGWFSNVPGIGSNPNVPVLDRTTGFTLSLNAEIIAESHAGNDRAGFSLIVLSQDHQGVELEFWNNEVWAQTSTPLFTHSLSESATFDTTAQLSTYALTILGSSYTLTANGSTLFSGALHDYSSFGAPYTLPNFVFFGDDSGSGQARAAISRVGLTVGAVPEPASFALVLLGFGCVAVLKTASRRKNAEQH